MNLAGLSGWVSQLGVQVATEVSSVGRWWASALSSGCRSGGAVVVGGLDVAAVDVGCADLRLPASMAISPMMSLFRWRSGTAGTAGLGARHAAGDVAPICPRWPGCLFGSEAVWWYGWPGCGRGWGLGNARLVGAMSVPPTWQGSMPAHMGTSAMSGMGAAGAPAAEMAAAAGASGASAGGGMPMMPMPMGGGGAAAGCPAARWAAVGPVRMSCRTGPA